MAQGASRERISEASREKQKRPIRMRYGRPAFLGRNTIPSLPIEYDETDIDIDDEEASGGEDISQDYTESERPDFQLAPVVMPLWILYRGRIFWAASHLGRDYQQREFFRRRVQTFLDFLRKQFPDKNKDKDKDDETLLLSMRGFFKAAGGRESAWLNRLDHVGIVYGEGKIMPLSMLRAGAGHRANSFPRALTHLWIEKTFSNSDADNPFDWKNCKDLVLGPAGINAFCKKVTALFADYESNEQVKVKGKDGKEEIYSLGLLKTDAQYEESTIQRKRLKEWREWWDMYRKGEASI